MKKLYVHIGVHKTGTTLLQTILKRNKENLSNQSVLFANEFYSIFQNENIKGCFYPPKSDIGNLASRLDELDKVKEDRIVISYEGLAGALTLCPPYIYHNSQQAADMLKQITSKFDTYIIITTRRQDTFIESVYHQMLKWGTNKRFNEFIENNINLHSLEWTSLIKMYETNFSIEKISVLPYELCIDNRKGYILSFFNIFSNGEIIDKELSAVVNPSYSRVAMNISLFFNNYLSKKNSMKLRRFLVRRFPKKPGEKFKLYTDKQRENVLEVFQNENKLLFSKYLTGFDKSYYLGKSERLNCNKISNRISKC